MSANIARYAADDTPPPASAKAAATAPVATGITDAPTTCARLSVVIPRPSNRSGNRLRPWATMVTP